MEYFSVRMRASLKGSHVSGQERIVKKEELPEVIIELHKRPKTEWDFQSIKIEKLEKPPILIEKSLPLLDFEFSTVEEAHRFIKRFFRKYKGINFEKFLNFWLNKLLSGVEEGKNIKGALIFDWDSLELLDKGIRTIKFDWLERKRILNWLISQGRYTERTLDALALATKNIYCGVLFEICISDDPNYVTGYIASKEGYFRITPIKPFNIPFGGRIYFVERKKYEQVLHCLRNKALLIKEVALINKEKGF
jgi:6-carboxyhexanoate--CoA ligase